MRSLTNPGFGGTNAHAILEHYEPQPPPIPEPSSSQSPRSLTPFVFSAASETALVAQLRAYSAHLKQHVALDGAHLAWTLHRRRSALSTKAAFAAASLDQLASTIDAALAEAQKANTPVGHRANASSMSRLLGVFTGQGAQWPAMGAHLIRASPFASDRIAQLEDSLATLPVADRPAWSLHAEMLAADDVSRIAEAALSQPLCTAIQVVLVDLLRAAGIVFTAVVGHSSGEIAAAYAAGFVTASDAIRIAYYRGLYARFAGNESNGQKGAMLAAGTSWEDAQQLVNSPPFKGRLAIAAHNSPASVTLSGDADAVAEAKKHFDQEKKFARLLKVDTAYHSHHMLPVGDRYVEALQACGIQPIRERDGSCSWYSSVTASAERMDDLQNEYWRDNMTNAVLFADAVKNAVAGTEHIDLAIEVGPHPALKGPAMQNVSEVQDTSLPYCGVLSRGKNDVEAFSQALGFLWTRLPQLVDLPSLEKAFLGETWHPKLMLDLPSYQWNHGRVHWAESRISKRMRTRKHAHHEVLGFLSPDSNAHDMRWSNVLKLKEIPWLSGHQLQGQTVFPAAGYVAMALEASRTLAGDKPVELFELHQLHIPRAITFDEAEDSGVETLVTLTGIERLQASVVTAAFACYSTPVVNAGSENDMELSASGTVKIDLGAPDVATLPCALIQDHNMTTADADHFYASIAEIGYNYSGSFRTLSSAKRKLNYSSVFVESYAYDETTVSEYLVHPSMLDVAFQASFLAYSAPGDGRLWTLSVPTSIGTIRVNPELCAALPTSGAKVPVCATIDSDSEALSASIDIFDEGATYGMVQVEDLIMKPFAPASAADDRVMFTTTKFGVALPDSAALMGNMRPSASEVELAAACERLTFYYLRRWKSELGNHRWSSSWKHLVDWIDQTMSSVARSQHPTLKKEWSEDTVDDMEALISRHSDSIDVKLLKAVDNVLPSAVRWDGALNSTLTTATIDDWYESGLGFATYNSLLADMVAQVVHRYPHARILEIGAGKGTATKPILRTIRQMFSSYTYTDRSEHYFAEAKLKFKAYSNKMTFRVWDIDDPLVDQGELQSYDIIIASHVSTKTSSLQAALQSVRQLLKPGGYLLLAEVTNPISVRLHALLGSLPLCGHGVNGSGKASPLLTPGAWHSVLRKAGFGGVDACSPEIEGVAWPMSIIAAQAIDERVQFLRRPLFSPSPSTAKPFRIESLVVLGNRSLETSRIAEAVTEYLERFCGEITILDGLPTEDEALNLAPMSTFLNLVDLDSPIFKDVTDEKMEGLKRMLELAKSIVWITHGGHSDKPYQMASIAFGRTIRQESAHININHMDLSDLQHDVSQIIAEYLMQQITLDEWSAPLSALADVSHQGFGLLWSREPEVIAHGRKLEVPRLVQHTNQNARLNSSRRAISKIVPLSEANVQVIPGGEEPKYALIEQAIRERVQSSTVIRSQSSTLKALNIAAGTFLYLGIGMKEEDKFEVFLSTSNSSTTTPITTVNLPVEITAASYIPSLMVKLASELLAGSLIEQLSPANRVLVHCSGRDRLLAATISRRAAAYSIRVTFVCDSADEERDPSWVSLNSRASDLNVRQKLRQINPTCFVDLTTTTKHQALGSRIVRALPPACKPIDQHTLFHSNASLLPLMCDPAILRGRLESAMLGLSFPVPEVTGSVVSLDSVRSMNQDHATCTIDWRSDECIEAEVRPLDSQKLFSKDKTYLLVGLSGQIGQSLCEWMISNGAGCVCLTSRRPKVDERWLASFQGTGAIVKVMAMDVLDPSSIAGVVQEIAGSCPPIAGVANGAVIFDDQLFSNMSGETMRRVLAPKIDGSINLDNAFYDISLDFFILFSSVVCVYGNAGQSNYSAANGFLNALARQRRNRGLAASTLDLGMVAGIGYAQNAGQAVQEQLVKKVGLPPVSETDLRLVFAETILAGSVESEDSVVIAGLRAISDDENLRGPWFSNPYFSHMILETRDSASGPAGQDKTTALPVGEQLAMASSKEDALDTLKRCFATKLRAILQLGDQEIEPDAPLLELGIDSLVAVEVRSWFLKELKVDIPVLKVVGGVSLKELCEQALEKLPEKLVAANNNQQNDNQAGKIPAAEAGVRPSLPEKAKSSAINSESSSTSGDGDITPSSTGKRSTGLTTPTTPFSATDDQQQAAVKPTVAERPVRKFLKGERISLPQSRFWFLRHLLEDPTTPNVVICYRMTGNLRIGDLERAIRIVTGRHEALRTCFVEDTSTAGEAYQSILPSSPLRLERKKVESTDDVDTAYNKLRAHVFDLEHGDVMRLVLLTLSSSSHYLLINYHHIVMDGASWNVFFSDLEKAYVGQSLGPAPMQYPEFSAAQRRALDNGDMKEELKYWRTVFPAGEQPPILPLLPMARSSSRVAMDGFDSHQVSCHLDHDLVARVKAVSKAQRSTPFHVHLAAFKALLFCFAGDDTQDLTIGFADAARNDSSVEKSIGFFLNLLTLRFQRQSDQPFAEAIVEARKTAHAALETSRLPFDVLLTELNIARSSLHSPFFQAFLDYRQGVQEKHAWGNCEAELGEVRPGRTAYDITLDVTDSASTDSHVVFRVQKSLYDLDAASLLLETYVHLLDTVTKDPSLPLKSTPLFSEGQLSQAVQVGRGQYTPKDYLHRSY
jgi:hybrid polyketide synthase/nonribosomal peptide synthetase ACE1